MTMKSELIEVMAEAGYNQFWQSEKRQSNPWSEVPEAEKQQWRDQMAAALSAHSAFLAERGLKVVGREATEGMAEAGYKVQDGTYGFPIWYRAAREAWAAMHAAAPDIFSETTDAG